MYLLWDGMALVMITIFDWLLSDSPGPRPSFDGGGEGRRKDNELGLLEIL